MGNLGEGRSEAAATTRASFVSNDRVDVVATYNMICSGMW
jgi:hypothetical protein